MYDPADVSKPVRMKSLEQEGEQHPLLKMLLEKIPGKSFFPDTYKGLAAETSEKDILQARATYYGLMTEIDHHLGRLFSYLKKTGQYESTMIVFTSDHGEQLGDHHLFGKHGYFDGSYAIPLIIRNPEITTPTSVNSNAADNQVEVFTEAIDVMPTILDWLDLEIPEELDGCSLLPLLNGNVPDNWRKEAHWEYDFREIGSFQPMLEQQFGLSPDQCSLTVIRDERYKYVHMTALPPLLFDLQEDPQEFINRAEDPDYRHLVLEYAQKMLSWSMLHRDRTLVNINMKFGNLIHWKGPRVLEKFEA
jgi:arylsulfatase A-like enzyme